MTISSKNPTYTAFISTPKFGNNSPYRVPALVKDGDTRFGYRISRCFSTSLFHIFSSFIPHRLQFTTETQRFREKCLSYLDFFVRDLLFLYYLTSFYWRTSSPKKKKYQKVRNNRRRYCMRAVLFTLVKPISQLYALICARICAPPPSRVFREGKKTHSVYSEAAATFLFAFELDDRSKESDIAFDRSAYCLRWLFNTVIETPFIEFLIRIASVLQTPYSKVVVQSLEKGCPNTTSIPSILP